MLLSKISPLNFVPIFNMNLKKILKKYIYVDCKSNDENFQTRKIYIKQKCIIYVRATADMFTHVCMNVSHQTIRVAASVVTNNSEKLTLSMQLFLTINSLQSPIGTMLHKMPRPSHNNLPR